MSPTSKFKEANQLTYSDAISTTGFDSDASSIARIIPIDNGSNIQFVTNNNMKATWDSNKQVRIYQ